MVCVGGWAIGAHTGRFFLVGHLHGQYCTLRRDTFEALQVGGTIIK